MTALPVIRLPEPSHRDAIPMLHQRNTVTLIAVMIALTTSGCAGFLHPLLQSYPGLPQQPQHVAFVMRDPYKTIAFETIDGETRSPEGHSYSSSQVLELAAGPHRIRLFFNWAEWSRVVLKVGDFVTVESKVWRGTHDLLTSLDGGHYYMIRPEFDPVSRAVTFRLQDVTEPSAMDFAGEPPGQHLTFPELLRGLRECIESFDERCRRCYNEFKTAGSSRYGDAAWYVRCSSAARLNLALCADGKRAEYSGVP